MLISEHTFIFLNLSVIRIFRGTCSFIEMLMGYMARDSLGTPAIGYQHRATVWNSI